MSRRWFLALPLAAVLLLGACGGGGDDDEKDDQPAAEGTPTETPIGAYDSQGQPTVDQGLPMPTPVLDDGVAITVVGGDKTYQPTVAEFRRLPTIEIDAGGKKTGVSLQTLADQVGVTGGVVTVQGLQANLTKIGYTRHPLADIGSNSVLVLDEQGHLNLYSTAFPEAEWLKVVVAVSFN
ncbi:MAG: hypothetical protein ACM3S1_15755 [Hyphomicrobiales bacterium]